MDYEAHKARMRKAFDTVAPGYDKQALQFFPRTAHKLLDHLQLQGHEQLLDVACGTGVVALAAGERLGTGRVTGIDLSEGMLARAREKAAQQGLGNIEFQCRDIDTLALDPASFDAATCSFGMFFLADMEAAARRIATSLRPGGCLGITAFASDAFQPVVQHFFDRFEAYGGELPDMSWKRLSEEGQHAALYTAAGMEDVQTRREQVGYYLETADKWWDVVWNAGFRSLLMGFDELTLERFKAEHLEEVAALADEQGIWLDVEVLISRGRKGPG